MEVKKEIEQTDTSQAFLDVFRGKDKFDSWEDFIILFEEFQRVTHSAFKPRSGTCVSYVNEKRVIHKIPEKFVYQTVNMICYHYGVPRKQENCKRRHSRYVGKNCEAFVKLSYKKGFLHITDSNLVHINHTLDMNESADAVLRKIRLVNFNDELDLLLTQIVDENKVLEFKKEDVRWKATLFQVQDSDPQFQHLTQRMLKKRIHFLLNRYLANSGGGPPSPSDHMGIILHRMAQSKKSSLITPPVARRRGRKRKSVMSPEPAPVARRRGRPRKRVAGSEELVTKKEVLSDVASDELHSFDGTADVPDSSARESDIIQGSVENDMSDFFSYWKSRDEDERNLRREEISLRREEMEVKKKEMELQKEKFEFERSERLSLMELLKAQSILLQNVKTYPEPNVEPPKITEFFVLKDGTLKQIQDNIVHGGTFT